jgi:hypothetical protein
MYRVALDGARTGGMEYDAATVWPDGVDPADLGAAMSTSALWR